ncbi:MAG: hypothetical protein SF053_14995 [Bacteroidia bacterium]|nr:hypothetical protein [Bacteroidia bacterium]
MKPLIISLFLLVLLSCDRNHENLPFPPDKYAHDGWHRLADNPVFRDTVSGVDYPYEIASDPHVFVDENAALHMIYTGDVDGKVAIKLASGSSWQDWKKVKPLLDKPNAANTDVYKETACYRKSSTGKHQLFYIGYEDEETYTAQIFLAEADTLAGTYHQYPQPVVPRGMIAGKNVYCMTSPSILEHDGNLYLIFIGWNDSPTKVSEVWIIGATSTDEGHSWTDFQLVDTHIGMEGQVTQTPDGRFVAVRTGQYRNKEGIYYSTADHPWGPWTENPEPILMQAGAPYEKDEIIAAQITIDPVTGKQYLYYTGANHRKGYWIMMATQE